MISTIILVLLGLLFGLWAFSNVLLWIGKTFTPDTYAEAVSPGTNAFIYVLQSGKYLKVGITRDFNKRISNYLTHNPDIEVIGRRKIADHELELFEKQVHAKFAYLRKDREWFHYSEDIIRYALRK